MSVQPLYFFVFLADTLEKYGISVWVDVSGLSAGVDFLSKIGEAIIDCKVRLSQGRVRGKLRVSSFGACPLCRLEKKWKGHIFFS